MVGKRGKVRGMPGPGGGGQGRGGPVPSGSSGGARNSGGSRRTKLKPLESRAKLSERPNTVVIEGKWFSVLPSESELVYFMDEVVLTTQESKKLFSQIKSVYVDENKRQYLIKMEARESMIALADLLLDG